MKPKKCLVVLLAAVFVFSATSSCTRIMANVLKLTPKENKVTVEKNVMIPTRDGLRLATDLYKPRKDGKFPVVLCRLPYGKDLLGEMGRLFAQRGYIFIIQDCRATFHSEGEVFVPFVTDEADGRDTIKWISEQPWFNGSLAMWGASYFGYTQWVIADNNPYLKCFHPQITTPNLYQSIFSGGAFLYSMVTGWSQSVGKQHSASALGIVANKKPKLKKDEGLYNMPLQPDLKYSFEELGRMSVEELSVVLGLAPKDAPNRPYPDAVEKMISLFSYPAFAYHQPAFNYYDRYKNVKAPAYLISGWYDIFLEAQLQDFVQMKKLAPEPARTGTRLVVGPWGHADLGYPEAGKDARTMELFRKMFDIEWYDYWVKGVRNKTADMPPLKIYVMGKNIWREENEWPLARTRFTDFYLHSQGRANSAAGDGKISTDAPAFESTDEFTYDPLDPVPSMGGNNLTIEGGAMDQKEVEKRKDVLVFTSEPLDQELEITGPIRMILFAASSATDTDFTAKLCVLKPNGQSLNLADGIIRARYRKGYDQPELLKPGEVVEYEINMWATSYAFQPGERIRVQISSSNFPRFDRNSNCGGGGGEGCVKKAYQTIYHDQKHPSRLVLPVIP